jgi:protein TonB
MSLRCLLFSSHEEIVPPIWQVLADLGIEGEHCPSAVDAVERVTTQVFQIVITDWDDQPEAAFLLKTARELKAAQRPLTLAIVSDSAKLPEALQAGANSVLLKPLKVEQVRDTMSTACQLLRSKQQPGSQSIPPVGPRGGPDTVALAAAASAGAASAPASVVQMPEKTFRAGEFLQSSGSAPGQQFDTESEVQKSLDQAAGAEVDALTELEPMASAVQDAPPEPAAAAEPLTGWAALQARLTKAAPQPVEEAPAKNELLSYGETPSFATPQAEVHAAEEKESTKKEPQPESASEAALFAYVSGEVKEAEETEKAPLSKRGRVPLVAILAATCVVLVAVPRTRQSLLLLSRNTARAGRSWLNPPPAPLPQAVAQHDSFGQSGDEYNLPTVGNIPDATTDPAQIRVLPVVDPTAKPEKGADANAAQAQVNPAVTNPTDQNQAATSPGATTQAAQNQPAQSPSGQAQVVESPVKDPTPTSAGDASGNAPPSSAAPVQSNEPPPQAALPQPTAVTPPVQNSAPQHSAPPAENTSIPSSLKSQIAASTPDPGGAMPAEAAMSSIEPVNLPEAAARELLTQPVDPEYPAAAKASGQRGSVVLQVFIGRDGAVQDAKFLQGSLVFARAAIDAVKQWRFKPYSINGRAVAVQSVITLKFQPPA